MDDNLFTALDRMIEKGGQKVAKAAVVGNLAKKAADTLLADLEKHDYIRKESRTYTLTEVGRRAWEAKASAARKQELGDRQAAAFLVVVQEKQGKPFTAKQLQSFDADLVKRLLTEGLVVEPAPNKYGLTPKGEEFLRAREPLDQQLKRLRSSAKDLLQAPQALLERLARESEKLAEGGAIRSAFAEARSAIQVEVARAQAEFERSLDGLQAFGSLIAAAQKLKSAQPESVSAALSRIDAEAERVQKLELEMRQTADKFREQLEQARQQMSQRAAAAEEKARAEKKPAGESVPASGSASIAESPADEVIWQATRRAYEQLEQQFKLTAELIKIPKLTDLVRAEVAGLTVARFHELLQRWQREDRLVLQVCNNPHFEPRSAEGIPSSRGLMYYIEMK